MIFISYQRASKPIAKLLREQIGDSGLLTWMDEDIQPGREWKVEIDNALNSCTAVLVLVTLKSLTSQYVSYEWSYALGKGKIVIPVILEEPDSTNPKHPKIHPKLQDRQYQFSIDAKSVDWHILVSTLKTLEEGLDIPPEVQAAELALLNPDAGVRKQGIDTLEEFEHPAAENVLIRAVQSKQPYVSMFAGLALARRSKCQNEQAIPGLLRCLTVDASIHDDALRLLTQYGNTAAVEGIIGILQTNSIQNSFFSRKVIIEGLCNIRHPLATNYLITLVESYSLYDKEVIVALGNSQDPIVLPALKSLYDFLAKNIPEYVTRADIVDAIARINHPDVPGILVEIIRTNASDGSRMSGTIFENTLNYLKAIGGNAVIKLLESIPASSLSRDNSFRVNQAIAEAKNRN